MEMRKTISLLPKMKLWDTTAFLEMVFERDCILKKRNKFTQKYGQSAFQKDLTELTHSLDFII